MEDDESLVVVAPHGAVPVDADGAPGDGGAGDKEVGGDVKSVADAGGHKGVEAVKRICIEREDGGVPASDNWALVVVDADGIEAHAGEVGGEALGILGCGGRVGAVNEVHAAEVDFLAGTPLQLEVVPDGDDAAELARRLVVRHRGGEVKRRSRLDPVLAG